MRATVHAWWIDTDAVGPDRLARLSDLLSDDEHERLGRYRFSRDRRRFLARRGVLRELLGGRLGVDPARLRFAYSRFGKPSVVGADLRFNLAHSRGLALYVAAWGRDVGCDVERRDPALASSATAERLFSRAEARALRGLDPARRVEAFFNCWTRKEAYVKARGCGLSLPLDSFDVTLAPGEPAALLRNCEGWSIRALELGEIWHACVVGQGEWRLRVESPAALQAGVQ
jgi:4'-phosphopantetheinyl transferase